MNNNFCEVYLVRHGETDWNSMGRIQGHTDIPLNELGLAQAADLNKYLAHIPFSAAFSSDLSRAKETAKLIIQSRTLPLIETPALRERWAGSFEGKPGEELDQWMKKFFLTPEASSQEHYLTTPWHPELETLASVFQRVRNFLMLQAASYVNQSILVVTHGGVIRSFLDHLLFTPKTKWMVSNCGFVKLKLAPEQILLDETKGVTSKKFS